MGAEVESQIDIYSHERADLAERLEALNGRSTWREPHTYGSHGSRPDNTPHEHTLAAGLAYARNCNPKDIGPDILESIIYKRPVHASAICDQLVRALQDMSSKLARANPQHVRLCAMAVIRECSTGAEEERPEGVKNEVWVAASALGIRLLWASAGATLREAGKKLR